jgi:hypothetical protein
MTNKLVVIMNSLKYQKLRKVYYTKRNFLYQITAASRTLTRVLPPPDPRSLCPLSSIEFVEPSPPRAKFLGTPLVSGTSRCLFSDKYKTHKYSVGRAYSCWMLNCRCITWPVGFKMLILDQFQSESLRYFKASMNSHCSVWIAEVQTQR